MNEDRMTIEKMLRVAGMSMAIDSILDAMVIVDADLLQEIIDDHSESGDFKELLGPEGVQIGEDMLIAFRDFKLAIDSLRDRTQALMEEQDKKSENARNN